MVEKNAGGIELPDWAGFANGGDEQ